MYLLQISTLNLLEERVNQYQILTDKEKLEKVKYVILIKRFNS